MDHRPKSRTRRQRTFSSRLKRGEIILRNAVVNSPFFSENEAKRLPNFSNEEIIRGGVLGRGEFGVVEEVAAISLSLDPIPGEVNRNDQEGPEELSPPGLLATSRNSFESMSNLFDQIDSSNSERSDVSSLSSTSVTSMKHVIQDRNYMAKVCMRHNKPRYAIKRVRMDLDEDTKAHGIIDLALEAHFLAVLNHPNIIHLRATSSSDPISSQYFLVLDRLECTIEEKIMEWNKMREKSNNSTGGFFSKLKKKTTCDWNSKSADIQHLNVDRILAMYDISRAMRYIHNHDIIYRDLKPSNIGFDVRGNVKIFDFGLAKELDPKKRKVEGGLFNLTGLTGSRRYMAPEVILCKPYNLKADVYSFAIVCWELTSLKVAFDGYDVEKHSRAVISGERPKLSTTWPITLSQMIHDSYSQDIHSRPSFERIVNILRGSVSTLVGKSDTAVLERSNHLANMSYRSTANRLVSDSIYTNSAVLRKNKLRSSTESSDVLGMTSRNKHVS